MYGDLAVLFSDIFTQYNSLFDHHHLRVLVITAISRRPVTRPMQTLIVVLRYSASNNLLAPVETEGGA